MRKYTDADIPADDVLDRMRMPMLFLWPQVFDAAISFSNRCFPTKAIKSWLETDDVGRIGIVCSYFQESNASNHGNWKNIKVFDLSKDDRDDHPSSPHYSGCQ